MSSPPTIWPDSRVGSIAGALASDIVSGRFTGGEHLNSVELARRFDSSRTPIREALLLLEKEGLIQIEANRRPRVKQWTLTEVRELYQVRAPLNALVSELIVANATGEQLAMLDAAYAALCAASEKSDVEAFYHANVRFRDIELSICGNGQLRRIIESLGLRVQRLRYYSISLPGGIHESCSDRGRLLRAYHERDASLASAISRSAVLRGLARIERSGLIS